MLPLPGPPPYDAHRAAYGYVPVEDRPGSETARDEAGGISGLVGARRSVRPVIATLLPSPCMGKGGVSLPNHEVVPEAALTWRNEVVENVPTAEPQILPGYPPEAVGACSGGHGVDLVVVGMECGTVERRLFRSFPLRCVRPPGDA